ncbi:MAG: 2OG-Fe(II) oxygenase, partial [Proteobacteria bacterium]|nr:2OG-Fe(II) oxygenase [Pseudomonadota bacterium]
NETGTDLSQGHLRVEYCQDVNGFWLEPHVDISVKLFTMLVYLSDDPALYDAGTDIYDASPEHKLVGTAPYEKNKGLIFIPGTDTWHGFTPRPIKGVRKSIIINYVSPAWRDKYELA